MAFAPVLNEYCELLGCSNKELAERCGISMSALSRYRNGKRVPRAGADVVDQLAEGIAAIALERGVSSATSKSEVRSALREGLMNVKPLGPSFSERVDSLMKALGVKNADVAIPLHLDSSYISRIRRGERTPNDKVNFANVVAQMCVLRCMENGMLPEVLKLIGYEDDLLQDERLDIDSAGIVIEAIRRWLLGNQVVESDIAAIDTLFEQLNSSYCTYVLAQMEDYDDVSPLNCKFDGQPISRFFTGEDFAWRAELRFLENAIACGATELFLSSDMPALETNLSRENQAVYQKKMLQLIKRGCKVTVVHSIDRSLRDSLEVMTMWIPLYMTGQVESLYLSDASSRLFCHANNVCDCCCMASEAVRGHEESGRYYMSSLPEDIEYYQKKRDFILAKALPLLEVYRKDDKESFRKFKQEEALRRAAGNGRVVRDGWYDRIKVISYLGDCAVIKVSDPKECWFVIRHPKLRYAISHMD